MAHDEVALPSSEPMLPGNLVLRLWTLNLKNLLPQDKNEDQDSVFQKPSMWLDMNGKSIHMSSAVQFLLSSEIGIKSTDCLHRVRGYCTIMTLCSRYA